MIISGGHACRCPVCLPLKTFHFYEENFHGIKTNSIICKFGIGIHSGGQQKGTQMRFWASLHVSKELSTNIEWFSKQWPKTSFGTKITQCQFLDRILWASYPNFPWWSYTKEFVYGVCRSEGSPQSKHYHRCERIPKLWLIESLDGRTWHYNSKTFGLSNRYPDTATWGSRWYILLEKLHERPQPQRCIQHQQYFYGIQIHVRRLTVLGVQPGHWRHKHLRTTLPICHIASSSVCPHQMLLHCWSPIGQNSCHEMAIDAILWNLMILGCMKDLRLITYHGGWCVCCTIMLVDAPCILWWIDRKTADGWPQRRLLLFTLICNWH